MKHKMDSRLLGEISIASVMQMTSPLWKTVKRNWRVSWWKWKSSLKTQHSKNEDHGTGQSFHGKQGEKQWKQWETWFWTSKITADGDYSHVSKRHLLLGRKAMTNLGSILKSRDITLLIKVHLVKAMVFPVVTYGCENWTIKKAEWWRIDGFELWC